MKLTKLSIISCLVLAACSNESTSEEEVVSADALIQSMADAQCERIFSCCKTEELDIVLSGAEAKTQEACVDNLKIQLGAFFGPSIEAAQEKNRISIDLTEIDACGAAIASQSCENITDNGAQIHRLQACKNAVVAEQEGAGFCDNDFECKSGFCVAESEGGSCKVVPSTGDACQSSRCGEGHFCDENQLCQILAGNGEACVNNASCLSGSCSLENNTCDEIEELCND